MEVVEIFKALSDENRVRIVSLLIKKELCVCEIETLLDLTQSNVSRHLNKLKSVGIVSIRKDSQWVYYRINEKFLEENWRLYEYLCEKARTHDLDRLRIYINHGYNCYQVREDRTMIVENINNNILEGEINADL